jgi:peptide/nickel transport system substrate-binding protein
MHKWRRAWLVPTLLIVGAALALAACGGEEEEATGTPAATGTATGATPAATSTPSGAASRLVIASVTTPPTIDSEYYSGGPQSWEVGANLYDQYFGYEGQSVTNRGERTIDFNKIVGRLIESADVASDGVTWTLHLRHGVKSCTGTEMTAKDVKYAFDRAFGLNATGVFLAATVNLSKADNVRIVDDYTVEIVLDAYSPIFKQVYTLYYPAIVDSEEVKKHATTDDPWATKWLATNSAGFGAYCVTEFTAGQQVVMEANPNYWEGEVPIKEVIYRAVPDASNRLALLQGGDVDIALVLSPKQLKSLEGTSGITIAQQKPGNTFIAVALNVKVKPFDDVKVRQALSYAIPYDEIVNDVYQGYATAVDSYLPPNYPGYTGEFWNYTYDLDKAKELLTEAGYPDGFDFELTFAELSPAERDVALAMQSAFKEIGVNMSINIVSPAVHQQAFVERTKPAIMYTANSHIFDGPYTMLIWLGSGPASYLNAGNYSSQAYDDLQAQAAQEKDPEKRLQETIDLQKIAVDDAPWLMPALEDYVVGMRDDIQGFHWMPDDGLRFYFLSRK